MLALGMLLLQALELGSLSRGVPLARLLAGSPDLRSHDVSRARPVNQDSAPVQLISLLVKVLLHGVHVLAYQLQTLATDRFCGAASPSVVRLPPVLVPRWTPALTLTFLIVRSDSLPV